MEKKNKKNYSIIIAIALISVLIVAMLCIGCSKKDGENTDVPTGTGDVSNETVLSGENTPVYLEPSIENSPDFEKNTERDEEGNKINVSENINKDKLEFEFLELSNISLKYVDNVTEFNANIFNNSDDDYLTGLELKIVFLDDNGHSIYETHMLTSALPAHGESNLQGRYTIDCSYANSVHIEVMKSDV